MPEILSPNSFGVEPLEALIKDRFNAAGHLLAL